MLILFDIDGTLLLTQKAGIKAMGDAGRELFGEAFTYEGVESSGRLDPLIWQDLAMKNGIADHEAQHERFRAGYAKYLARRLENGSTAYALPGVLALIEQLRALEHITIGLLTGNYPETGKIKMRSAGIDPDVFTIGAWGIDGPTRRDLPRVAMQQYRMMKRAEISCESIVIIGDTPHDIDCARAGGCRALGVATGAFSVQELIACGADRALEDLSQTQDVTRWLLEGAALPGGSRLND